MSRAHPNPSGGGQNPALPSTRSQTAPTHPLLLSAMSKSQLRHKEWAGPEESSNTPLPIFHARARDPCIHPPKGNIQAQGLHTELNLHVKLTCHINPLLLLILRPGTSPSTRKKRAAQQYVLREGSRDWPFPTFWQLREAVLSHLLSHTRQQNGSVSTPRALLKQVLSRTQGHPDSSTSSLAAQPLSRPVLSAQGSSGAV